MHAMLPDIRENSTFLRYHEVWKRNPSSVVFAPLAEILILHKCFEEAITICKKGLEKNPGLISGRIAFARAYFGIANYRRACAEALTVLKYYPNHPEAMEICNLSEQHLNYVEPKVGPSTLDLPTITAQPEEVVEEVTEVKKTTPVFMAEAKPEMYRELRVSELDPSTDVRWNTVTMAEIFASQGNLNMAKRIYRTLLEKDPANTKAKNGLESLAGV